MSAEESALRCRDGRWEIPVIGGSVVQVRIDFAFGLLVDGVAGDDISCDVRISSPFHYDSGGASGVIDPEQTERLAPLLVLHNAVVVKAFALDDGHLELRFARDRAISVPPDPNYEAWGLTVANRSTKRTTGLVSLPGGGTAAYDSP